MILAALLIAATHPCMQDAQKLCAGVKPGGGRVAACLKSHEKDLSAECRAKRADFREDLREARDACAGDAEKLCKGIPPGRGRLAACLKSHESELTPECRAAGQQLRGQGGGDMREKMQACRGDAQKLCKDVPRGGGAVARCLADHQGELSQPCRDALAK